MLKRMDVFPLSGSRKYASTLCIADELHNFLPLVTRELTLENVELSKKYEDVGRVERYFPVKEVSHVYCSKCLLQIEL